MAAGCGAQSPYRAAALAIVSAQIGVESKAALGETILAKGKRVTAPALMLETEVDGPIIVIPPQMLVLRLQNKTTDFFIAREAYTEPAIASAKPLTGAGLCVSKDRSEIRIFNEYGLCGSVLTPQPKYALRDEVVEGRDGFVQELVYGGRSGSTIKLTYREFSDSSVRPSFVQDIVYDLTAGDEFDFRGTRMKIVSATNTDISYVVLNSFADPK